jgi:hypothetical protein
MILLAILAIWLVLITFSVILCRVAAAADDRTDAAAARRYPSASANVPGTDLPGPALEEGRSSSSAGDPQSSTHGARGHAGRSVA